MENEGHSAASDAGDPVSDPADTLDLQTARRLLEERARRISELESLRARLVAREARLATVEAELAALQRAREAEVRHLQTRIEQLERLYPELLGRDERIASLQEQLDAVSEAAARTAVPTASAGGPPGSDARGSHAYADWERWFRERLDERTDARLARLEATTRHQQEVLVEKEALIADLASRPSVEVEEGPDDLKRIKGIGPAIEKLLHEMGIASFQQLANLNEIEVELIANQLDAFRDRIWRDGWIEQARLLAERRRGGGAGGDNRDASPGE